MSDLRPEVVCRDRRRWGDVIIGAGLMLGFIITMAYGLALTDLAMREPVKELGLGRCKVGRLPEVPCAK